MAIKNIPKPNGLNRICLVIPSLGAGGMEKVMYSLAGYFSKTENTEVHLVVLKNGVEFFKTEKSIRIYRPEFNFNNKARLISILRTLSFLRKTIKKINPYSVLSFGEMYNSFVLIATWHLKTRVFVSDRSSPDKNWGIIQNSLRTCLYGRATGLISQTEEAKRFLLNKFPGQNIKVIPNPISLPSGRNTERKNIILNVGRLISTKRIDVLLEIFKNINPPDWELWIVGDGSLKGILQEKSEALMISHKVIFWGEQKDISGFCRQAKIFAFTSISEGFPNALLEAMASGAACISFNCIAGPADLIDNEVNGYLVNEFNINEYTARLKDLIENNSVVEKFSLTGYEKAKEFSLEIIGKEFYDFLIK
jgi:glycosyltransferase involved in cell wall biosynthesis